MWRFVEMVVLAGMVVLFAAPLGLLLPAGAQQVFYPLVMAAVYVVGAAFVGVLALAFLAEPLAGFLERVLHS